MKSQIPIQHALKDVINPTIAVVRSLPGLGDLLCCIPALRALRSAFPHAHIALIGLSQVQPLVERFHAYLDDLLIFPGFPGIPEVSLDPEQTSTFLVNIQALKFDLALQLHGSGICMNAFSLLLGAKFNAGFFSANGFCPDSDWFLPYPATESEIWRHLRLMQFLGIPLQGTHLEFPLTHQDWQDWQAIAQAHHLSTRYVCLHPGASIAARRSHPRYFAHIADLLAAQGLQVVLTGTVAEADLTRSVAMAMQFPSVNLAGLTTLGTLAVLLKQSRLLVCNDTGVSHLAAALQVPSVVIFSHSDPQRWAPLDRERHRVVQANSGGESDLLNRLSREAFDLLKREVAHAA